MRIILLAGLSIFIGACGGGSTGTSPEVQSPPVVQPPPEVQPPPNEFGTAKLGSAKFE